MGSGVKDMTEFIEIRILNAVKRLLDGKVNELINDLDLQIPLIEFSEYRGGDTVVPLVSLNTCERSEKERLVRIDAYTVTVSFSVPDTEDGELKCYAYAYAVCKAFELNPALDGVADRAVVTEKKYMPPKSAGCGQDRQVIVTLRITTEGANYAG